MNEKNNAVNQAGRHTSAPSPAAGFEVLLITGMSGAGRSHAANSIEDMLVCGRQHACRNCLSRWWMMNQLRFEHPQTRRGHDVRSRDYFDDLSAVLSHLDDLG